MCVVVVGVCCCVCCSLLSVVVRCSSLRVVVRVQGLLFDVLCLRCCSRCLLSVWFAGVCRMLVFLVA